MKGHNVTVISQDPAPVAACYEVRQLRLPRFERFAPLTFPFQVANLDLSGFDVVHAQGDDQWLRRSKGLRVVRTLHGSSLSEAFYSGWRRRSLKHLLLHGYFYGCDLIASLRAGMTVAISSDTRRHFPRVSSIIGNGVDLSAFRSAQGCKSVNPSILFVGEMNSRKRGSLLLETFKRVIRKTIPAAELWVVAPEHVVSPGVCSFRKLSERELAELYSRAWVFCLPSSYEGFGRPYVEAMASGVPVVTSPNPGSREVLADGAFGVVVPDNNLGETITLMLQDQPLREKYSQLGRTRAELYDWKVITAQYEAVYESIMAASRSKDQGWLSASS